MTMATNCLFTNPLNQMLFILSILGGTAALKVLIAPENGGVIHGNNDMSVMCAADRPITHCQFRLRDDPPVDLSQDHLSDMSGYVYQGHRLSSQCGTIINGSVITTDTVVECRVRTYGSDWRYATTSATRGISGDTSIDANSRLTVVLPGGDANFLFLSEVNVISCMLISPVGNHYRHDLSDTSNCGTVANSICPLSRGFSDKQCGTTIRYITEEFNGVLWFDIQTILGWKKTMVQLIVARPPTMATLTRETTRNGNGTVTLRALCTVIGSRPAANISWHIAGRMLTDGNISEVPHDAWVRPYEVQTTVQQLTLVLDAAEDEEEVWCTAHHIALPQPLTSNKIKLSIPTGPVEIDPCNPSPCGPNVPCWSLNQAVLCECTPGDFRKLSDGECPECKHHPDCSGDRACVNFKCVDPCMAPWRLWCHR